ncbi:hypothetical protein [Pseudomonas sp. TWI929]|uniref:hypothetical protein n=1 Tax=Pseudomonas sp. TWI929 TaxID=3136795 RepID=UPI003207D438
MTTPAEIPQAGGSDQKSWPIGWQIGAYAFNLIVTIVITCIPLFKNDADSKPKGEYYTKAEVQQIVDTAVQNIRYSHQADIDDLFTWTANTFQYNNLPTLSRPTSFRDRSPAPPLPPATSQPPVLPPREYPHQKKQGTK